MKILSFLLCLMLTADISAQELYMSDETTDVTFETKHFGGKLEGTVKGVKGTASFDTSNLTSSSIKFSIASSTFIHNDNYIGPDLFDEECFDVKKNPTIDLVSSSITKNKGANSYVFNGALVIKGKSREVSFPFTATPNIGGYDLAFQFPIEKKKYKLDCAFRKKMMIKVKSYAKRKAGGSSTQS